MEPPRKPICDMTVAGPFWERRSGEWVYLESQADLNSRNRLPPSTHGGEHPAILLESALQQGEELLFQLDEPLKGPLNHRGRHRGLIVSAHWKISSAGHLLGDRLQPEADAPMIFNQTPVQFVLLPRMLVGQIQRWNMSFEDSAHRQDQLAKLRGQCGILRQTTATGQRLIHAMPPALAANTSSRALAVASDEAGFCPVTRFPSTVV